MENKKKKFRVLKKIGLTVLTVLVLFLVYAWIKLNSFERKEISVDEIEKIVDVPPHIGESNKLIVWNFYNDLYSSNPKMSIDSLFAEDYIEHQVSSKFSKTGLIEYVKKRLATYPNYQSIIHRVISQGNLVFLHIEEKLDNNLSFARGELFRIKDGRITEHWSNEQQVPKETASGNTMFDGAKVDLGSNLGRKYALQQAYNLMDGFINNNIEDIPNTVTERYIQHNPSGKSGIEEITFFAKMIKYLYVFNVRSDIRVKKVIAEGDFIVTFSYAHIPPLENNAVVFDIYRMTNDGKVDEHWDIIQDKVENWERAF